MGNVVIVGLTTFTRPSQCCLDSQARAAVQQSNFCDYTVMRMSDLPNIFVQLISSKEYPPGVG